MNKLTKGSLAAGAGIVLLLGGTGTFMSWNDTATAGSGTVTAGHLTVDPVSASAFWTVNDVRVDSIATYPVVPGDTVKYTTDLSVSAEGANLKAQVGVTPGAIKAATTGAPADEALADELHESASITVASPDPNALSVVDSNNDGVYEVDATDAAATATITATVTITFPFDDLDPTTAQNDAQTGAVSLADMAVQLTQVV